MKQTNRVELTNDPFGLSGTRVNRVGNEPKGVVTNIIDQRSDQNPLKFYEVSNQIPVESIDITDYKLAVSLAERFYYANRYGLLKIYERMVANAKVMSLFRQRISLFKGRFDIKLMDKSKEVDNLIDTPFFNDTLTSIYYALLYGYTLQFIGELQPNKMTFKKYEVWKRELVEPDYKQVSQFASYSIGQNYELDPEINKKFLAFHTSDPTARNVCGKGILFLIITEFINFIKGNNKNGDYIQRYGEPYKLITTEYINDETSDGQESPEIQQLRKIGQDSSGYAIVDNRTKMELVEPKSMKPEIFDLYIDRQYNNITAVILGHENAMSETAGKLGATQGGENSLISQAVNQIVLDDSKYILEQLNNELLPKMFINGCKIPINSKFVLVDKLKEKENLNNTFNLLSLLNQNGYIIDNEQSYLEDKLNIKLQKKASNEPKKDITEV